MLERIAVISLVSKRRDDVGRMQFAARPAAGSKMTPFLSLFPCVYKSMQVNHLSTGVCVCINEMKKKKKKKKKKKRGGTP